MSSNDVDEEVVFVVVVVVVVVVVIIELLASGEFPTNSGNAAVIVYWKTQRQSLIKRQSEGPVQKQFRMHELLQ